MLNNFQKFKKNKMTENEISYIIRGAAFEVFKKLGPGLLEIVYEKALIHELRKKGLKVESQIPIPIIYDGVDLEISFRLDLLVEDKVIVELKSTEKIIPVFFKQLMTHLKLTNKKLGLLFNFNVEILKDNKSIFRIVNNLT